MFLSHAQTRKTHIHHHHWKRTPIDHRFSAFLYSFQQIICSHRCVFFHPHFLKFHMISNQHKPTEFEFSERIISHFVLDLINLMFLQSGFRKFWKFWFALGFWRTGNGTEIPDLQLRCQRHGDPRWVYRIQGELLNRRPTMSSKASCQSASVYV